MVIYILIAGFSYEFDFLVGVYNSFEKAKENFTEGDHAEIIKLKSVSNNWKQTGYTSVKAYASWPVEEI
jgi:hypothetical protein